MVTTEQATAQNRRTGARERRLRLPWRSEPQRARATGAILFPELVWLHHRWQQKAQPHPPLNGRWFRSHLHWNGRRGNGHPPAFPDEKLERQYHDKLADFERSEGEILNAYWCIGEASAVALTERKRRRWRLGRSRSELRLHRATDWATVHAPAIAELLQHADVLAIKANQMLSLAPQRVVMEWLFAEQSHLLGYVERMGGHPPRRRMRDTERRHAQQLLLIERYYHRAAKQAAHLSYVKGMLWGLVPLVGLGALIAGLVELFGSLDRSSTALRDFYACYGAGALGALVSVMSRIKQRNFSLDYDVGKRPIYLLGSFRPVIGAIFGITVYFGLQSSFVQPAVESPENAFFFYALAAFLAGFSERFTHVILGNAELTVAQALGGARDVRPETAPIAAEKEAARDHAPSAGAQ